MICGTCKLPIISYSFRIYMKLYILNVFLIHVTLSVTDSNGDINRVIRIQHHLGTRNTQRTTMEKETCAM